MAPDGRTRSIFLLKIRTPRGLAVARFRFATFAVRPAAPEPRRARKTAPDGRTRSIVLLKIRTLRGLAVATIRFVSFVVQPRLNHEEHEGQLLTEAREVCS